MTSNAKLSDKLYRWRKPDGGWNIGRIIEMATMDGETSIVLVRCEFGNLYWIGVDELMLHNTSYREREKEAGQ